LRVKPEESAIPKESRSVLPGAKEVFRVTEAISNPFVTPPVQES
jgi:hypothetical protein